MMRRSFALVLVVTALGVLGACGGDSDGDTSSTTTILTPSGFTGEGSGEFCKVARDYSAKISAVGAAISNPAALKNVLAEVEPAVREAVGVAPSEVKTDVEFLANAFKELRGSLEAGTQPDIATLTNPQFQVSADRLTRYGREVCGIAP